MPLLHAFTGCLGSDRQPAASQLNSSQRNTLLVTGNTNTNGECQQLASVHVKDANRPPGPDPLSGQYNSLHYQSSKDPIIQDSLTTRSASDSFAIKTGRLSTATSSDDTSWLPDASADSPPSSIVGGVPSASSSKALATGRLLSKLQQSLRHKQQLKQLAPNQLLGVHVLAADSAGALPTEAVPTATAVTAAVDADALYPYILQHGRGIMSLSTLQEGIQHFLMPGIGYIAYAMMYNGPPFLNIKSAVALGDPICAPEHYASIAGAFLQQHPKAMFLQISQAFGEVLQDLGLLVNSIGGETELDLQMYTFSGYAKRGLRSAITSAVKEGITVHEVMDISGSSTRLPSPTATAAAAGAGPQDWSQIAAEMQELDSEWVKAKGKHAGRIWFINRLPVFAPEPGVRKLIARSQDGRLQAYIFFDAVYEGGRVVGYYANVTRMRPDAHPGVLNVLIKEFIERIRAEAQLAAPRKNVSIKRSQRKKQQQQQQQQSDTANTHDTSAKTVEALAPTNSSSSSNAPRFLSLGLSMLHQMDDSHFKHNSSMRSCLESARKHGSGFYPFKSLAAAKAKYGAGLHDGRYEDPNVTYKQVYLAHSQTGNAAGFVNLFDLGILIGAWKGPPEATAGLVAYKVKRRVRKLLEKHRSRKPQQ